MNIAILTSGGDAPGMNAAVRAVVRRGIADGHHIWGIARGFEGLVRGQPTALSASSVANILMTGGTILRTSRFSDFRNPEVRAQAVAALKQWAIDGLIVLGGNGSLTGAYELHRLGVPVVGIPASIDNDIAETDYALGFDTAMNNIVASVDKIRDTASAHDRIFVVEVMGNRCGTLAVAAGLACGAEAIIIPEVPTDFDAIEEQLKATYARGKKHSFIIVAEGAGDAHDVAQEIARRTDQEAKWVVLGHTQRGGPPTAQDRLMAALFADAAVDALIQGRHGMMVRSQRGDIGLVPLEDVVSGHKPVPLAWKTLAEILAR
ncbi:MAG: 6-phosphofructokinase [Firmicutes bacterium]|nr:6-phosphofructokinase [Bacillota bacterium]